MLTNIKGILTKAVEESESAKNMGSGTLDVFATPSLVAFVEKTCWMSIDEFIKDDETTVGTNMNLDHLKASPIGAKVTCESTLVKREDKKLIFEFIVNEGDKVIAKGLHERFIVNKDKFMSRVYPEKE